MSEKLELLHTDRVLIVEGKYDAARLSHLTDACREGTLGRRSRGCLFKKAPLELSRKIL